MPVFISPLYYIFLLGILLAAGLAASRTQKVRRAVFTLGMMLVNLGAFLVLLAAYLVSRLEGSTPPGLLEVMRPLWVPLLLVLAADAALLVINQRVRERLKGTLPPAD